MSEQSKGLKREERAVFPWPGQVQDKHMHWSREAAPHSLSAQSTEAGTKGQETLWDLVMLLTASGAHPPPHTHTPVMAFATATDDVAFIIHLAWLLRSP